MRKFLLATSAIAAVMVTAPAGAADMPVKARPLPPPLPTCARFAGFYIGGNVGYAAYDRTVTDLDSFAAVEIDENFGNSFHTSKSGFIGGIQGGYNWQPTNCTVFGIEVDYSWARLNGETFNTDGFAENRDSFNVASRLRGFGTIRARSGVVVDNLLLYVTGGFAFAKFERTFGAFFNGKCGGADFCTQNFEQSRTRWGWTTGVGAEWALGSWGKAPGGALGGGNWSIKTEFLYARFQRDEFSGFCGPSFCINDPRNFRFESNDSLWTTRIGLNYRFGDYGKGPVGVRAAY